VTASGVDTQFAYWQKELLKLPGAHAIIHDKILVIDPMLEDCVVITGSHNQGYRASYANDENFVIVRGHQLLAQAYATHVMDVYDHYRWRFILKTSSVKSAFSGLDPTPKWQAKYFTANSTARRESLLWTGQLPPLPDAPAPPVPMRAMLPKGAAKPKKATKRARVTTRKANRPSRKTKKTKRPARKKRARSRS
jgi:hypothetical protein